MQQLNLLWSLFVSFADILLWPEQAVNRQLRESRLDAERRRKPRTIWEILHRVFIVLVLLALCLLLIWR